MTIQIRPLRSEDEAQWRRLWAGYLRFYNKTLTPVATDATWARALSPDSQLFGRVAVDDHETVIGFVLCVLHEGTWSSAPNCYLEDLFVDDAYRGRGAGRALIADVLDTARAAGWANVYWMTEASNAAARRLYDTFTAADGYVRYRIALDR